MIQFNRTLTMTIKVVFSFLLLTFSINGFTQKRINGFSVNKESNSFDILNKNTNATWFSNVSAGFKCNGELFLLKDMTSKSIKVSKTTATFGKGEKLDWLFIHPSKNIAFTLELISYPGNGWHTVNAWVENKSKEKITLDEILLIETDQGILTGESWKKWRVLNGRTDNLKWAGEVLTDEKSKIRAMTQMGLWNTETDQEAVLGYSIKHAWGALELSKSESGMNLQPM